ncbi:L,D-transpeptidase family protein [Oricola sp.]|uniref:L,D-transpeptidase family protein n=1 Tax=Oricola sp. TaxID=1979950 RepID=UPI0025E5E3A6|nr:L,D-transpeptidase family protein [Oricola sp.]MCI5077801.1 L,D-transpeptidase family protein [Oricola sp.]
MTAAIAIPAVPVFSVPSQAQVQLHELLFGGGRKKREERRQEEVRRAAPAKIVTVSSPRYYTYKPEAMTTVSIASLMPEAEQAGGLEPSLDFESRRFAEATALAPDTSLTMEKDIAAALKAHYAANPKFIWSRGNSVTDEAKAVAAMLEKAADQGLEAADYAVAVPRDGWSMDNPAGRTADLLAFEMTLSARAIRYAQDVKDGAVIPDKLSGYHDFPLPRLGAEQTIGILSKTKNPGFWLKTLEPRQEEYAALKRELASLRAEDVDEIVIPSGTFVKVGQTEPALPLIVKALRKRVSEETRVKHAATFAEYLGGEEYTHAIAELVRDFQRENGLVPDGIVGRNTISHLSDVGHASKVERVELAMERLRWHPEEFGMRHVVINQPAFRATYTENGVDKLSTRAVIGKKSNQTSFFFDEVETVVYNPYWGVPQSIIVNEMLPKLYRDPSYLDRAGYEVTNASGRRVSSASVQWWNYSGKVPYDVRQKPGPSNALGEVKILFPNKHSIYMHDTPSRHLFDRDVRAFSHGCVRLQQPQAMAAAVLGKSEDYVRSMIAAGGGEKAEKVAKKVPVFISYYTAWPTAEGKVEYFSDIYDRDIYLDRALKAVHQARGSADS